MFCGTLNRGGNYNSGNANGFASANLNNGRDNQNVNIGFRAALPAQHPVMMLWAYGPTSRAVQVKGSESSVGSRSELMPEEKRKAAHRESCVSRRSRMWLNG